jgi:thioredoxin 2
MAALDIDPQGIRVTCPSCGQKNRVAFDKVGHSAKCGQCKQPLDVTTVPLEVATTEDFDYVVTHASVPVVVDYWAPWCGPCRMVAPELEKVARRSAGRFLVLKVNTDALADLGERYGIRSIPMLAVFSNGREVTRSVGARPAADIEALISQAVG